MSVIKFTNENFDEEAINYEGTVLIDFWAQWCVPCSMFAPIIDEIAQENIPNLKVGKINIDEENDLAMKYSVMTIPTTLVIRNGEVINKAVGVHSKEDILEMIK